MPPGKRKILFLAQLPPPVHGASVVSGRVHGLLAADDGVEVEHLWLGGAERLEDVGQRSLGKLVAFARLLVMLALRLVTFRRYDIAYMTLAPWSHAAIRDGLLVGMSKLLARRTVAHLHAEGLDQVMAGASLARRTLKRLLRGAELVTITEKVATAMRATGHFRAVHLVPNCVPDPGEPAFSEAPALRCGYLANLDPRKGVLRFLEAIAALRNAGIPVEARIAGPSTAAMTIETLRAEVETRGLGKIVSVLGPLYGDRKVEFLRSLDLFIYLSRRDYFPLVVIEAMSCGVVPVVYDNEGEAELVGPPFAKTVVSPGLKPCDRDARLVEIAAAYHADRRLLAADRRAARQRFLDRYGEARFADAMAGVFGLSRCGRDQSK